MKNNDGFASKGAAFEASEDIPTNTRLTKTFAKVAARRYGRRDVMRGALGLAATTALGSTLGAFGGAKSAEAADGRYVWTEIEHGVDETHHVAEGHSAQVLIRWGDPVFADSPEFDPMN
ncbi:MAG TPA: DUF839 domain-containing protein, partial [Kiloniellaceae bacterium]|nr:DUF839 domain-containing protein [Kiloniellaceae bacterium]